MPSDVTGASLSVPRPWGAAQVPPVSAAAQEPAFTRLDPKRQRFLLAYLEEGTAAAAARAAGYSEQRARQTGSEIMRDPLVQAALAEVYRETAKRMGLAAEKVLVDIERVRRKAEQAENYVIALKASELQGKYLQMWNDKTDITVNNNQQINVMVEFIEPGAVINTERDPW